MVASEGATRTAERPPRGVVALKPVESRSPATETQESREMLVADGEEPGKPSFLHRLAPMAALVLMLGLAAPALIGVVEVLGLWRSEPDIEETYWLVASGKKMPSLRTEDSRMLQHWLAARLGYSVPAVPTAAGFPIIGGDIQTVDGNQMAMVAYGNESSPVLMFMRPADDIDTIKSGPFYSAQDGLNRVVWTSDGYTYEIISTLPGEKLHKLFEIQT